MFDKIQWKQEWRLSPREEFNYYGNLLHKDMVVELTDDNKTINVVLSAERLNFEAKDFYGFAGRSLLVSAHVIPNELLEFVVCSYLARKRENKVKIQKISSNEYSVQVYADEYKEDGHYAPPKDIKEVLTKAELTEKLSNIQEVFEAYPFLELPLANCFDES